MRGHLNIAARAAKANEKREVRNYHLLRAVDLDAYQVVLTYREARRTNTEQARAIAIANPDLLPYFLYVTQEQARDEQAGKNARIADIGADRTDILTNPEQENTGKVDQYQEAV